MSMENSRVSVADTKEKDPQKNVGWLSALSGNNKRLSDMRSFFISRKFMIITAIIGALFVLLQAEVAGAVFFVLLMSFLLVVCDDVLTTTLPFLILCLSVLQCYDSFDTFIKFAYFAVIPVGAVIFHFVFYRRKFVAGKTLWGIVAVAVAVTLGGLGAITADEYFSGTSLYYIAALGFGMVGAYALIKSQIHTREDYDIREKFVDIMYIMGIFACFQMLEIYGERIMPYYLTFSGIKINHECVSVGKLLRFAFLFEHDGFIAYYLQPSNNLSTFIMMALPFPLYRALNGKKESSKLHLFSILLMALCIFISKSRGGWYMGALALVVCCVFALLYEKRIMWKIVFAAVPVSAAVAVIWYIIDHGIENLFKSFIDEGLVSSNEARLKLLFRSFNDFKDNPVFGQGIGNVSNSDIYSGKTGTMTWYHMMIPQIYGSMGTVGVLAYGYQLFGRIAIAIRKRSLYVTTLALSYGGLFFMSQVNPGEFCPIPYGLIAVILFIMIECEPDFLKKKPKPSET